MPITRTCEHCHKSYKITNIPSNVSNGKSITVTCPHCYQPDGEIYAPDDIGYAKTEKL